MNITKTSATGALIAAAGAVALGFAAPAANAAVFPNNPVNVTQCSTAPQHPPRNA